jgi:fermentation-respiration switch protein FrsA (DUF1100 family)
MVTSLLLLALLPFLLAGAYLFWRQDRLIFHPSAVLDYTPADLGLPFEDLYLPGPAGGRLNLWWVESPGAKKTVLFFHGTGGNLGNTLAALRFHLSLGANVLLVDYPGYGRSDGRPSERGLLAAGEAAWAHAREARGIPADDLILHGQSLGTGVATYLAASRACGGLVFQSGMTSVPDLAARAYPWLPTKPFCRTRLDSLSRIGRCACPILVIHSADDRTIPLRHAERIYRRASGPKAFVRLAGPHLDGRWAQLPALRARWRELLDGQVDGWAEHEPPPATSWVARWARVGRAQPEPPGESQGAG